MEQEAAVKAVERMICIVSDSTGDLGSRAVSAALQQFTDTGIEKRRFLFVRSPKKVREAMETAAEHGAYVVYTLVDADLREYAQTLANHLDVKARDLIMGEVVQDLTEYLGQEPRGKPGTRIDAAYLEREQREWDALKFAIEHDDGQRMEELLHAEIVIVGVSRVRKSQVSKELALKGFMVANVPLCFELPVPEQLEDSALHTGRVFALTMMPARLRQIRRKRLEASANGLALNYAELDYIRQDLAYVEALVRRKQWTTIDGTDRGIEETAAEIVQKIMERFPPQ